MSGLVLGIDLGGSSLRVGLVAADGTLAALAAAPHRIGPEAEPEEWWRALRGLLGALDLAGVVGIGLSGIGRSQVFADAAGRPVRPAICFADGRAAAVAAALAGADHWTPMSAFHPLARIAWLRAHEPRAFAATRHVLTPKDWLAMRLTGIAATDSIGAAWALGADGLALDEPAFARAGILPGLVPPLRAPWQAVGHVRDVPGLGGVPVFCGALDTWCATLGVGVGEGDGYVIAGTTDAAGMLTRVPARLPGRVTLPWGEGMFHTGGPSGAGGACLDWFAGVVGLASAEAVAELARSGAPGPLFLPDLDGVRAPMWEAAARGAFFGLAAEHDTAALARAVLEGVALADAAVLEGLAPARVVLAGGGARSDFWCAVRASVFGVAVERPAVAEPGVVGAGLAAWIGLGALPGLAAARALAARGAARFVPAAGQAGRAAGLRTAFARARAAGLGVAAALADLSHEL